MEPLCHNLLQVGLVSHSFRSFGHFYTHLLQLQSNQGTLPRKSACSKLSLSWCVNHNYCVPFRDSMATQVDCDQLKAMKQFAFQQGPRVQNDFLKLKKTHQSTLSPVESSIPGVETGSNSDIFVPGALICHKNHATFPLDRSTFPFQRCSVESLSSPENMQHLKVCWILEPLPAYFKMYQFHFVLLCGDGKYSVLQLFVFTASVLCASTTQG